MPERITVAASLSALVRSCVCGMASHNSRTAVATGPSNGTVRCGSRTSQFKFATSSDGGVCLGRYRSTASLSVGSTGGVVSTVSNASAGALRNTRSCNCSPSAGTAPSGDIKRTGKLVPSTLIIHWPEGSRVTAASRIAPTRHCVSCCDPAPVRPDEVYVTDSMRIAGSVADCELHHPDIGSSGKFLSALEGETSRLERARAPNTERMLGSSPVNALTALRANALTSLDPF